MLQIKNLSITHKGPGVILNDFSCVLNDAIRRLSSGRRKWKVNTF